MDDDKNLNLFHYYISQDIVINILSTYLTPQDVARLDSAMCNKAARPVFLGLISSRTCIWRGTVKEITSGNAITWLRVKNMKIRQFACSLVNDDITEKIAGFDYKFSHLQSQMNELLIVT